MKFLVILLFIGSGVVLGENKNFDLLTRAFSNITKKLSELERKIVIMNFCLELKIVDLVMMRNLRYNVIPYVLKNVKSDADVVANNVLFELDNSAVLTFDSVESLKHFNDKVVLINKFPKSLVFYVICLGATFDDISSLKETVVIDREKRKGERVQPNEMQHILQLQYFIVEEEESIRLLTFVWYSSNSCSAPQITEVNRFDKKMKTWKNSNLVEEKFENFHGCPLVFGVWFQGFAMEYKRFANKTFDYAGYNIEFLYELEKDLNYTVVLNPFLRPEHTYFYKNVSVDLFALEHCYNYYDEDNETFFITRPYIYKEINLAVPPGEKFSGYEKLFLPFDLHTWILIVVTFAGAFLTIFLLTFATQQARNFVYGRNVETPWLNVAAHFFGISQVVLPGRNFARFMTMMFILYSLIIRTAWQGKMFEFLQKDLRKPEIQSLEELIRKNYTILIHQGFQDRYVENLNILKG